MKKQFISIGCLGALAASSLLFSPSAQASSYCESLFRRATAELREENKVGDYFLDVMQRSRYGAASASELIELQEYSQQQSQSVSNFIDRQVDIKNNCGTYTGPGYQALKSELKKAVLWGPQFLAWVGAQYR